jgi:Holliday junction DNA helicase RuvA
MYEYFKGKLVEKAPASVVIDCNGVAYHLQISLQTYGQIKDQEDLKLFAHQVIKEDAHQLFGFASRSERTVFRHLISVSGVGANTARLILSSLSTDEVIEAVVSGNENALKSVKGIGLKTAQRVILDLKDKIGKGDHSVQISGSSYNTNKEEALTALTMLGFGRPIAEKALQKVIESQGFNIKVEDLIRSALKIL